MEKHNNLLKSHSQRQTPAILKKISNPPCSLPILASTYTRFDHTSLLFLQILTLGCCSCPPLSPRICALQSCPRGVEFRCNPNRLFPESVRCTWRHLRPLGLRCRRGCSCAIEGCRPPTCECNLNGISLESTFYLLRLPLGRDFEPGAIAALVGVPKWMSNEWRKM